MTTKLYTRDDLCFIMYAMLQDTAYWADVRSIEWAEVDGIDLPKSITLHDHTNAPEDWKTDYTIRLNDVEAAIEKVVTGQAQVTPYLRKWIASGDAGMIDAEAGDALLQIACFGQITYG